MPSDFISASFSPPAAFCFSTPRRSVIFSRVPIACASDQEPEFSSCREETMLRLTCQDTLNQGRISTMPRRIAIHAGHVIAFDGHGHRLLRDGTVLVDDGRIVSVGRAEADEAVEAPDGILTPGLISTHAHIGGSPLDRSFIEDRGNPQFFFSGLFELLPVRGAAQDEEATRACVDFSMAELLRGGVTTVMEIGGRRGDGAAPGGRRDWGLRVYVGHAFRSGRWLTRDGRRVEWEWDEEQGRRGLARAIELHKQHDGSHGDLVRCFFSPAQVDTCTPDLLKASKRA